MAAKGHLYEPYVFKDFSGAVGDGLAGSNRAGNWNGASWIDSRGAASLAVAFAGCTAI